MQNFGKFYICSTPIGNLEDITLRALRILKEVDLIACEDTRRTIKLLNYYQIKKRLISYYEFNEKTRAEQLLNLLKQGKNIALVSSSGTPLISDPGFEIVRLLIKNKIPYEVIPGADSILPSLVVSGLEISPFAFFGFLPKKNNKRKKFLEGLKNEEKTLIFFESPQRLNKTLEDISNILGNRKIAIVRELTKKFEEIIRGDIDKILKKYKDKKWMGEITLLVEGLK